MTDTTERQQRASQRFVERLAEEYRPAPQESAQRTRFDANLRERIARRRAPTWAPSLVGAVAALVLAWSIWPASAPLPQPAADVAALESLEALESGWEADVLLVDADAKVEEAEYLPDEYVAIASVFIDGL